MSDDAPTQRLPIGGTVGGAFKVYFRDFGLYLLTGLVLSLPGLALAFWAGIDLNIFIAFMSGDATEVLALAGTKAIAAALSGFFLFLASFLLAIAVTGGVAARHDGNDRDDGNQGLTMPALIGLGFRRLLPIIGVGIVGLILLGIPFIPAGLVALLGVKVLTIIVFVIAVIASIYVYIGAMLAWPTCVVEQPGVIASLRRGFALAKKSRWRIILAGILFSIGLFLVSTILWAIVGAISAVLGAMPIATAVGWVANLTLTGLQAAFTAVLFVNLRTIKEGRSAEALADVFD